MLAKDIIAQMPPLVRKKAETKAAESGKSLEEFVQEQVAVQLSDETLDAVSGGAISDASQPDNSIDWSVVGRIDHNPFRGDSNVGGGVVFRF